LRGCIGVGAGDLVEAEEGGVELSAEGGRLRFLPDVDTVAARAGEVAPRTAKEVSERFIA